MCEINTDIMQTRFRYSESRCRAAYAGLPAPDLQAGAAPPPRRHKQAALDYARWITALDYAFASTGASGAAPPPRRRKQAALGYAIPSTGSSGRCSSTVKPRRRKQTALGRDIQHRLFRPVLYRETAPS
jgi:hypothetical protein